jgi:hypothetical protein
MTSVRTTQMSFLLFRFLTIPFLLLLVFALALEGLTAHAEPAIGLVLSHEKSLPVLTAMSKVPFSVVTILARGVPTTPTQPQLGSGASIIIDESEDLLTNNHKAAS